MSKFIAVISIISAVSACQPISTGGAGKTTDGEPLAGTISANANQSEFVILISSPSGWQCSGITGPAATPTAIRQIPLKCTDGATGSVLLTGNQFQQQVVGSFQLSNGKSGQVTFGLT